MPPKRAEVGTIRVFPTQPSEADVALTPNFIVMDSALMRITQHKKSKHAAHRHGIDETLPDEFMGMLKDSLARWPRTHIFVDSNGNGYTPGGFSKWVRRTIARLFGDKSPSVSLLRHSYCTSLDYKTLTGAHGVAGTVRKPKTNTAI
jgi:hypothetical protein